MKWYSWILTTCQSYSSALQASTHFQKQFSVKPFQIYPKIEILVQVRWETVYISPTFQMMPSQAKGPDPGSHTVLTCPDWLIPMQSGTLPRSFLNFYDLNSFGGNQPDTLWNVYQCRFAYCLLMLPLFGHQVVSSCLWLHGP